MLPSEIMKVNAIGLFMITKNAKANSKDGLILSWSTSPQLNLCCLSFSWEYNDLMLESQHCLSLSCNFFLGGSLASLYNSCWILKCLWYICDVCINNNLLHNGRTMIMIEKCLSSELLPWFLLWALVKHLF